MDSLKVLPAALGASLALHAAVGSALFLPAGDRPSAPGEKTIQVDFVREDKAASAAAALPVPVKKLRGIPARWETPVRMEQPAPPTDFQKLVDEKIQKQLRQLKRLEEEPIVPRPKVSSEMTSAELLSNPEKGKVFLSYFGNVKKKIQDAVYQKAARRISGRGSVCLGFVLSERGTLERLAVIEKGTHADALMRELAQQCLREAAPFAPFPKDLGPQHISFNITIFFDSAE